MRTILEQVFLYPAKNMCEGPAADVFIQPILVEDLVDQSKIPVEKVIQFLQSIRLNCLNSSISHAELAQLITVQLIVKQGATGNSEKIDSRSTLIYDMRESGICESSQLPEIASLLIPLKIADYPKHAAEIVKAKKVIMICDDGSRSFSVALYLRQNSVLTACYLENGLF